MRLALACVACGLAGFAAACGGSGSKHHFRPSTLQKVQPPQQTGSVKTGTPTGPSNTSRTTTSVAGG